MGFSFFFRFEPQGEGNDVHALMNPARILMRRVAARGRVIVNASIVVRVEVTRKLEVKWVFGS